MEKFHIEIPVTIFVKKGLEKLFSPCDDLGDLLSALLVPSVCLDRHLNDQLIKSNSRY